MKAKTQSIPNKSRVTFSLKDISIHDFVDEFEENSSEYKKKVKAHDGKQAIVDRYVMATSLGDKDYEYYDIRFNDGFEISACSGYHLNIVPRFTSKVIQSHKMQESKIKNLKKLLEAETGRKVILKEWSGLPVSASIVMMSHLSDVQEIISNQQAKTRINFVKFLINKFVVKQEIDADAEWKEFCEKFPNMCKDA